MWKKRELAQDGEYLRWLYPVRSLVGYTGDAIEERFRELFSDWLSQHVKKLRVAYRQYTEAKGIGTTTIMPESLWLALEPLIDPAAFQEILGVIKEATWHGILNNQDATMLRHVASSVEGELYRTPVHASTREEQDLAIFGLPLCAWGEYTSVLEGPTSVATKLVRAGRALCRLGETVLPQMEPANLEALGPRAPGWIGPKSQRSDIGPRVDWRNKPTTAIEPLTERTGTRKKRREADDAQDVKDKDKDDKAKKDGAKEPAWKKRAKAVADAKRQESQSVRPVRVPGRVGWTEPQILD